MKERIIQHTNTQETSPFIPCGPMSVSTFFKLGFDEGSEFYILNFAAHQKQRNFLHFTPTKQQPTIAENILVSNALVEHAVLENGRAFTSSREYSYQGKPLAFAGFTHEWWQDAKNGRYFYDITGLAMIDHEMVQLPLTAMQQQLKEYSPSTLILTPDLSLSIGTTTTINGKQGCQEITIESFCLTTVTNGTDEHLTVGASVRRPYEPLHIEPIRTILAHDRSFHPLPPGI